MDMNDKLDAILTKLDTVIERQEELQEQIEEFREALSDRNLPGSNYDIISPELD